MLYRPQEESVAVRDRLGELLADARDACLHRATAARDLLVDLGELEAGVADDLFEGADGSNDVAHSWRRTAVAAGALLSATLARNIDEARRRRDRLVAHIEALAGSTLPRHARIRPAEGYAHYGLFPEQYAAAAADAYAALRPTRAVVVGLRSIGTSLSAIVSATLEDRGCAVLPLTVRPRGHPFDRDVSLAPELAAELARRADDLFLVVDEGPGLSGSSLTGAARAIVALGVPDERVVLLPSWMPHAPFVSERAREQWRRHRKFTAPFEPAWVSGLEPPFEDLSAGAWRRHFCTGAAYPPVQPQHERRKYLVRRDGAAILFKFTAIGRRARAARRRAEAIADAGWGAIVRELHDGFLAFELDAGAPQTIADVDASWLDAIARYLAFVRRTFHATTPTAPETLAEMARVNVREALGDAGERRVDRMRLELASPVQGDARMLPHEWLRGARGFVKADGVDHASDHFYPGPTDVAWDLAGAIAELHLDTTAADALVERYARASGDNPRRRLPAYEVAYLAFRSRYAATTAMALAGSPEGDAFAALTARYRRDLTRALARLPPVGSRA